MTTRDWKPYTVRRQKIDPNEISVTLSRDAELAMSLAAYNALRCPASIALFYDESDGLIGVVATDSRSQNAIALRNRNKGKQRKASLGHFLTTFGIPRPENTITFPKPTLDPDGTLVLNYREAMAG